MRSTLLIITELDTIVEVRYIYRRIIGRTVSFVPDGPILKETLIAQHLQSGHLSKAEKKVYCPASVPALGRFHCILIFFCYFKFHVFTIFKQFKIKYIFSTQMRASNK